VFLREEYMAPVYSELLAQNSIAKEDVLLLPHLHATLDHRDWRVWLENAKLGGNKKGRDTVFFSLDLALSACLSGQGVTVTDLLLVLPELKRQFLLCPQDIELQHSDWQYYCYKANSSEITAELLNWLQQEIDSEISELNSLCRRFGWQPLQS
jgi:LysR family glycine cleavage system transcriptional activator